MAILDAFLGSVLPTIGEPDLGFDGFGGLLLLSSELLLEGFHFFVVPGRMGFQLYFFVKRKNNAEIILDMLGVLENNEKK